MAAASSSFSPTYSQQPGGITQETINAANLLSTHLSQLSPVLLQLTAAQLQLQTATAQAYCPIPSNNTALAQMANALSAASAGLPQGYTSGAYGITTPADGASYNTTGYPTTPYAYSASATGNLQPEVQAKLDMLYALGLIGPSELDPSILKSLSTFSSEDGMAILEKLGAVDLTTVVNKNGFLAGIMKRFRGGAQPADTNANLQAQYMLPQMVQLALEQLYNSGVVQRHELDAKVISQLNEFDENGAIDVINRFQSSNLSTVTNKSGFFVGIMKRVRAEQQQPTGNSTFPAMW
jgi:hypothetical protein